MERKKGKSFSTSKAYIDILLFAQTQGISSRLTRKSPNEILEIARGKPLIYVFEPVFSDDNLGVLELNKLSKKNRIARESNRAPRKKYH